jgi:hypothetical protein
MRSKGSVKVIFMTNCEYEDENHTVWIATGKKSIGNEGEAVEVKPLLYGGYGYFYPHNNTIVRVV